MKNILTAVVFFLMSNTVFAEQINIIVTGSTKGSTNAIAQLIAKDSQSGKFNGIKLNAIAPGNACKGFALVKQQIDQLANHPVSQKQLRAAQKNLIGSFPIAIASNEDLLAVVTRIAFYDRPLDYMTMFDHHIHQVSAQDIQQAFKRLTTTHPQVIVTVGPNVNHAS